MHDEFPIGWSCVPLLHLQKLIYSMETQPKPPRKKRKKGSRGGWGRHNYKMECMFVCPSLSALFGVYTRIDGIFLLPKNVCQSVSTLESPTGKAGCGGALSSHAAATHSLIVTTIPSLDECWVGGLMDKPSLLSIWHPQPSHPPSSVSIIVENTKHVCHARIIFISKNAEVIPPLRPFYCPRCWSIC